MSSQSITYEIDDNVVIEDTSEFGRHSERPMYGFQIVSIYVNNRCINSLCQVGGVQTRSPFIRHCCKSNLIVHNNMDATSHCVVLQRLHLDCFVADTLP